MSSVSVQLDLLIHFCSLSHPLFVLLPGKVLSYRDVTLLLVEILYFAVIVMGGVYRNLHWEL